MAKLERAERNTYICDVVIPRDWQREFRTPIILAVGRDPDLVEPKGRNVLFSFSFNTQEARKQAIREIRKALGTLDGPSEVRVYRTAR